MCGQPSTKIQWLKWYKIEIISGVITVFIICPRGNGGK